LVSSECQLTCEKDSTSYTFEGLTDNLIPAISPEGGVIGLDTASGDSINDATLKGEWKCILPEECPHDAYIKQYDSSPILSSPWSLTAANPNTEADVNQCTYCADVECYHCVQD